MAQRRLQQGRGKGLRNALLEEDVVLTHHLRELGLGSAAEYQAWCLQHGFAAALRKGLSARRRELAAASEEKALARLTIAKRIERHPDDVLHALYGGEPVPAGVTNPVYERLQGIFAALGRNDPVRRPFLELLLHARRYSRLLSDERAMGAPGDRTGNTWVEGLLALARWNRHWVRAPEGWRPPSKNARRQFSSLARHLLANWDVPLFLDNAFFQGDIGQARLYQEWFRHIGQGQNIRSAPGLPITLTKRAAHLLMQASKEYPIEHALRWAQIKAMGGSDELVRAVLATPLGESFQNEEFWVSVLQFFVNHPLLDRAQVGPIVDYIQHRKYEPQAVLGPGYVDYREPPDPGFSMKGRTPAALLRLVEEWHRDLALEKTRYQAEWAPSGLNGLILREILPEGGEATWTLREIRTTRELFAEGRAMGHCVGTYASSCIRGAVSVWTLRVAVDGQEAQRVMTVAAGSAQHRITEARGRFNALPGDADDDSWLNKAPRVLKVWAEQQGLAFPDFL